MTKRPNVVSLDPVLNLAAARQLAETLRGARGHDLEIDASHVEHLGAQCGQVLLAGMRTWVAEGHAMRITKPTPSFEDGANALGLHVFFFDEETAL